MNKALARFLLAFMLVWLPLQAYAAGSMPYCQRHHHHATPDVHAMQHMGCHGQSDGAGNPDHGMAKAAPVCDDCASCHLLAQPALMLTPLALGVEATRMPQPSLAPAFTLFFPEQPQRPPLALLS